MQITKIEIQKKNKARYSLYADDVFLFGISEDTLIHFGISKGKDYSDDQLKEIQRFEQVSQCLHQSYRYLQRRAHLRNELRTKLRQKQYSDDIIDQTLEILRQKKYLDDEVFIRQFITEAISLKKMGPLLIRQKLLARGAARQKVDDALRVSYTEENQMQNAASLAAKKRKSLRADKKKLKQKLFSYLRQKGYASDVIVLVLENVAKEE